MKTNQVKVLGVIAGVWVAVMLLFSITHAQQLRFVAPIVSLAFLAYVVLLTIAFWKGEDSGPKEEKGVGAGPNPESGDQKLAAENKQPASTRRIGGERRAK